MIEEERAVPPSQQLHPVKSKEEIVANSIVFDGYCNEKSNECHAFANEKMKFGKCFVAMQKDGQWIFSPSKFAGYTNNAKESYEANIENIDGRETNFAITKVLGVPCEPDTSLNEAFQNYCQSKGISVSEKQRKFWRI